MRPHDALAGSGEDPPSARSIRLLAAIIRHLYCRRVESVYNLDIRALS
jgi:hypothetical protein